MDENLNNIIFSNYLKNKKIIIVGPASYLIGKKQGAFIDNFDIVIRIKRGYPVDPTLGIDLGMKTDILLSSLKTTRVKDINKNIYYQNNFKEDDIKKMNNELKFVLFPYPTSLMPFSKFYKQYKILNINTILITGNNKLNEYKKFIHELNTTPTIFLSSLFYLLAYEFKELYVIGITFQKDGYYNQYKSNQMVKASQKRTLNKSKSKNNIHDMEKEFNIFKLILKKDKRINIDNYIKNILNI